MCNVGLWLRNDTYYLRWRTEGKHHKLSLGHNDPELAQKQRLNKETELNASVKDKAVSEPQKNKISILFKNYLAANKRIKPGTRLLTEYVFERMIESISDIGIDKLDFGTIEKFQNWIIVKRSKTTANIWVKTVRPAFSWAVRKKLLAENPFKNVTLFKIPKKRVRIYTHDEFQRMLAACNSRLWRARVLVAKTTAMRRGEILNLTIDDVDFEKNVIYVQPKIDGKHTWEFTAKDDDLRTLPLVPEVKAILEEIRDELPDEQPYLMLSPDRYVRLMELKRRGKLLNRKKICPDENWKEPFSRIKQRAGIKKGTFHDLRRTCITEWLESGLKPHEVKELAGHSDIETTMNYYVAIRSDLTDKARTASDKCLAA